MELEDNHNLDFKKIDKSYVKKAILETSVKSENLVEKVDKTWIKHKIK